MTEPKHHHYVPRFYLSRFTDPTKKLWVFDKLTDKIFSSTPENVGGQNQFYRLDELTKDGIDALELEKQFADLEYQVSNITNNWLQQFTHTKTLTIPDINRDLISLFITTQLLRTVEAREQLVQFTSLTQKGYDARSDAKNLQAAFLWDDDFVNKMKQRISSCIWIFGINESSVPFCTSDHPVLIKTQDNKQWLLGPRIFDKGMYIVYPLSPTLIMYCKDPDGWSVLKRFENSLSPVEFTDDMVQHENSGQIGMSYRFIFSMENNFKFANNFLSENKEFKNPERERY